METCSVVLTFESVIENLWCDHSNETSPAICFRRAIRFLNFLFFSTRGSERVQVSVNFMRC